MRYKHCAYVALFLAVALAVAGYCAIVWGRADIPCSFHEGTWRCGKQNYWEMADGIN